MRSGLDAATLALYTSGEFELHTRLGVENGSGTRVNLSGRYTKFDLRQPDPSQPIGSLSIDFIRETTAAGAVQSLAPTVVASNLNRLDDGVTYSPLLQLGRLVYFDVALTAVGAARPADASTLWYEVFRGYITKVDWPQWDSRRASIDCNDQAGILEIAKSEQAYTYVAGTSLETVARQILDNNGFADVLLYFPAATGKVLPNDYAPGLQKTVWSQLWALAQSMGWVAFYRYRGHNPPEVTFFAPAREKTVPDMTVDAYDFRALGISEQEVRNVGYLAFFDAVGAQQLIGPFENAASIAKYGGSKQIRRPFWIKLEEDSPIRSTAEATDMLNAALSDVADPDAVASALLPPMVFAESGVDLYEFVANPRLFDSNQTLAPFSITVSQQAGQDPVSTVDVRGVPTAGAQTWRSLATDAEPTPADNGVIFKSAQWENYATGPHGQTGLRVKALFDLGRDVKTLRIRYSYFGILSNPPGGEPGYYTLDVDVSAEPRSTWVRLHPYDIDGIGDATDPVDITAWPLDSLGNLGTERKFNLDPYDDTDEVGFRVYDGAAMQTSKYVVAGTNITIDKTASNELRINATTNSGAVDWTLGYGTYDARYAPLIHASRHASGGADPITPAMIGAAATSHSHAWGDITSGVPVYATRWPSFSEVTSRPTTISGYGITDAYTQAQADAAFVPKAKVADWNQNTTDPRFVVATTNGPPGSNVHFGVHMPHTVATYATQLAGRDNAFYMRSLENGTWRSWLQLADRTWVYNVLGGYASVVTYGAVSMEQGGFQRNVNTDVGIPVKHSAASFSFLTPNASSTPMYLTSSNGSIGGWVAPTNTVPDPGVASVGASVAAVLQAASGTTYTWSNMLLPNVAGNVGQALVVTAVGARTTVSYGNVPWANIDNKPTTFAPSSHTLASHTGNLDWSRIDNEPVYTTRWPTAAEAGAVSASVFSVPNSRSTADVNTFITSGIYGLSNTNPNNPPASYSPMIVARNNDVGLQIAGRSERLFFRSWGSSGAAWNPWYELASSGNSAALSVQPSSGTYGAVQIDGSKGGYTGIYFTGGNSPRYLMVNGSIQGIHNGSTWDWYWSNGVLIEGTVPGDHISGTVGPNNGGTGHALNSLGRALLWWPGGSPSNMSTLLLPNDATRNYIIVQNGSLSYAPLDSTALIPTPTGSGRVFQATGTGSGSYTWGVKLPNVSGPVGQALVAQGAPGGVVTVDYGNVDWQYISNAPSIPTDYVLRASSGYLPEHFVRVMDATSNGTYGRAVDRPTSDYSKQWGVEFKSRPSLGFPGAANYITLLTLAGYSDSSSGATHGQLGFAGDLLAWRSGNYGGSWGTWKKLAVEGGDITLGTINATAMHKTSARWLKREIDDLPLNDARKVLSLRLRRYRWIDSGALDWGWIADEVDPLFRTPTLDAVYTDMIHAATLRVVQDHEERIAALEKENAMLRQRLS